MAVAVEGVDIMDAVLLLLGGRGSGVNRYCARWASVTGGAISRLQHVESDGSQKTRGSSAGAGVLLVVIVGVVVGVAGLRRVQPSVSAWVDSRDDGRATGGVQQAAGRWATAEDEDEAAQIDAGSAGKALAQEGDAVLMTGQLLNRRREQGKRGLRNDQSLAQQMS